MMMLVNTQIFIASNFVKKKARDARGEVVWVNVCVGKRVYV